LIHRKWFIYRKSVRSFLIALERHLKSLFEEQKKQNILIRRKIRSGKTAAKEKIITES
jgi:hypothetical protein